MQELMQDVSGATRGVPDEVPDEVPASRWLQEVEEFQDDRWPEASVCQAMFPSASDSRHTPEPSAASEFVASGIAAPQVAAPQVAAPQVAAPQVADPQVLAELRQRLRALEHDRRGGQRPPISSGFKRLDQALPGGGLLAGSLVEWLAAGPGCGTFPLALRMARQVCQEGGLLVVIDRACRFYPPALEPWGFALERLLWVRPVSVEDERWAVEQALRCPGVAAVWCSLGALDPRWLRRFQLAAEAGGTLGLLERPLTVLGRPSWSDLQLVVHPQAMSSCAAVAVPGTPATTTGWQLQLEVSRGPGAVRGLTWGLEIDPVSGEIREQKRERGSQPREVQNGGQRSGRGAARRSASGTSGGSVRSPQALPVRLVSQLAHPAARRRSARA